MSEVHISITLTDGDTLRAVLAHTFGIGLAPGVPPLAIIQSGAIPHAPGVPPLSSGEVKHAPTAAVVDMSSGPIPEAATVEVQGLTKAKVERLKKEVEKATPVEADPHQDLIERERDAEITQAVINEDLRKIVSTDNLQLPAAQKLLADFGVKQLKALKPDKFEAFHAAALKVLKGAS